MKGECTNPSASAPSVAATAPAPTTSTGSSSGWSPLVAITIAFVVVALGWWSVIAAVEGPTGCASSSVYLVFPLSLEVKVM